MCYFMIESLTCLIFLFFQPIDWLELRFFLNILLFWEKKLEPYDKWQKVLNKLPLGLLAWVFCAQYVFLLNERLEL